METMVPEGYKKTKVGIYPDDWKEIEVSKYVIDKKKFCNNDNIPLYSLTIEEGVVPKSQRYERSHLVKDDEDAYKSVEYRDFVYNPMNLRFGALAVHNEQKEVKVSAYYDVFGIKNDKVNLEYLYAYLKSERIMFYYNRMATGSLEEKKRVHYKEFKKFKFPMPLLKEQEKIAQILTTCDEAITKQEKLIKEKEQLKKGLMQKLLSGEVRFDGFGDEWEEFTIDELFHFKKGQGLSKEKLNVNGNFECILYGELYTTYSEVIAHVKSKTFTEEGIKSKKDDILIPASTTTSAIDLAVASTIKKDNILLGGDINILRKKKNNINGEFVAKYLTHIKKIEIAKYAQGITIIHLYSKDFKHLKIKLPSLAEQQKIAEVLSIADNEINLLKNELEELKLQKKALMQKLLTGQVRVKV